MLHTAILSTVVLASPALIPAHTDAGNAIVLRIDAAEVSGKIESVDQEKSTFVVQSDDKNQQTFRVNDKTQYTLDGRRSTMEAVLKAGLSVKVTHEDGLASSVAATTS